MQLANFVLAVLDVEVDDKGERERGVILPPALSYANASIMICVVQVVVEIDSCYLLYVDAHKCCLVCATLTATLDECVGVQCCADQF